ncbi:MAG: MliC family protein [Xanthomonadales bacterium]|nr:MliC family protein [Xanthomonadales bacterium]
MSHASPMRALLAVAASVLAGCAATPSRNDAGSGPQAFRCGDEEVLARFLPGEVELAWAGGSRRLPAAVAASGARYARGNDEFWTRGDQGWLRLDGVRRDCVVIPVDPWRDARARGAGFRAIGQEPGWVAELAPGPDAWLAVQLDYGSRTLRAERTRRLADAAGVVAEVDGETVTLRIRPEPCIDVMSGEAYEATAELRIGDRRLAGCGRFLAD